MYVCASGTRSCAIPLHPSPVFHFQQLGHTCHQFLPEEWFGPHEICNWGLGEMEPIDARPIKRSNH